MSERINEFTGKPYAFELMSKEKGRCENCGGEHLVRDCICCGAPICCFKCCQDSTNK